MIRPYSYQRKCIKAVVTAHQKSQKAALFIMAPGLGKTVTAAMIIKQLFELFGEGQVLFLCHQNDILEQAQLEFERVLGTQYRYGFFFGSNKSNAHSVDILFASFQTMREWKDSFRRKKFKYVVVDESHHSHAITYRPTLDYFLPQLLIGMTATPDRMDLLDIREIYGNEVFSLPLDEALAGGLLTSVDYRLVTDEIHNLESLDTPIGKLSVRYLNKVLFIPKRDDEIVSILLRHIKRIKSPRVMIFCESTKHCDRMAKKLPGSLAIHHKLSRAEQRLRLRMFRQAGAHIVLTVDKFNEGIDVPEANVIVFLRSTASYTVFFQQLGRGLRHTHGKEKVLVLDFVANCERLVMLEHFHSQVRKAQKEHCESQKKRFVEVKFGKFCFSEVAKRVLDVVRAIRSGYTREMLIRQLRQLAENLGRTPMTSDICDASKQSGSASLHPFIKVFGSFNAALEAAGLPINRTIYSREQLVKQLRKIGRELGRTPSCKDVHNTNKEKKCATLRTFTKTFGSFSKTLRAAGFLARDSRYDRKKLIEQLKQLSKKLGHAPRVDDVNQYCKANLCASVKAFQRHFGSFRAALREAGFESGQKKYSRKQLIQQLKLLAESLKRTPSSHDIERASKVGCGASLPVFRRKFGSLNKALKAAQLTTKPSFNRKQLIQQLKEIGQRLGRAPTVEELRRASKERKGAPVGTFCRVFGSFNKAIHAAGFQPRARGQVVRS